MKVNHYKMKDIEIKIIVSSVWAMTYNAQLMKDLKEKYLSHLASEKDVKFVTFANLCKGINFSDFLNSLWLQACAV